MTRLNIIIFILAMTLTGCASNMGSFSHFPDYSSVNIEAIDEYQDSNETQSRFFYNCNWVNDIFVQVDSKDRSGIFDALDSALRLNRYELIPSRHIYTIKAYRGQTSNEWETYFVGYIQHTKGIGKMYFRTEITQDATCGFNINRALRVAKDFCTVFGKCTQVKEVTSNTKSMLNLK